MTPKLMVSWERVILARTLLWASVASWRRGWHSILMQCCWMDVGNINTGRCLEFLRLTSWFDLLCNNAFSALTCMVCMTTENGVDDMRKATYWRHQLA